MGYNICLLKSKKEFGKWPKGGVLKKIEKASVLH